jgi:hypothetical protein
MLGLGERVVSGVELFCSRARIFLRPLKGRVPTFVGRLELGDSGIDWIAVA